MSHLSWQGGVLADSTEPAAPLVDLAADREVVHHLIERMEFFIRAISKEYDAQTDRYRPVSDLVGSASSGAVDG